MSNLRNLKDAAADDGLNPHEWLSCRAVAWLVGRGFRIAATEVPVGREEHWPSYKTAEQADACGVGVIRDRAHCCVVEVKVSRADFLADFKKEHREADFGDGVTERFYLLPRGLVGRGEVPDPWGLVEWDPETNRVAVAKRASGRRMARRVPGAPAGVSNLAAPWEYGLEDEVPGGRNAWLRAWWRVISRTVNAYEFGYLAIDKDKRQGGYHFGNPTLAREAYRSVGEPPDSGDCHPGVVE